MKEVSVVNQSSREGTPFASISKMLTNKLTQNEAVVCVVGLGYVGLPLAIEFSKSLRVIGYDINKDKRCRFRYNLRSNTSTKIKRARFDILGFDPLLSREEIEAFGIGSVEDLNGVNADCAITTVAHDAF
jgi:hypothetical protein